MEKEIDERTENMVALKADANNAFIKAKVTDHALCNTLAVRWKFD